MCRSLRSAKLPCCHFGLRLMIVVSEPLELGNKGGSPKIRDTLLGVPMKGIIVSMLGSPSFGNYRIAKWTYHFKDLGRFNMRWGKRRLGISRAAEIAISLPPMEGVTTKKYKSL